jgi:Ni/Co efflux regulator RcnB
MRKPILTSLFLLCALCLSQGSAQSQPGRDREPKCHPGESSCERGNRQQNDRRPQPYQDSRRNDLERQDHGGERGAGPDHDFYRGARLPKEFRNRQYVVNNWRGHGLRTPPRGYQWVQTGSDYVLVAIASGIILELLLSR